MNKKGFTLVELLVVIVILSLVVVIVATNGFGLFNRTKRSIIDTNLNSLKDAANILMLDILYCDENFNSDLLSEFGVSNCSELQKKADEGLEITVKILYDYNYANNNGIKEIYDKQPDYYVKGILNEDEIIIKADDKYNHYY